MPIMDSQLINHFTCNAQHEENFMLLLFGQNGADLSVNEEYEQMIINEVKEDTKNILKDLNILPYASNNLSQQEIGDTRNGEGEQQQFDPRFIDNSVSTNLNAIGMDTDSIWQGQQILSQTARTTDEEQNCHGETINFGRLSVQRLFHFAFILIVNHDDPTQGQRVLQSSTTGEYPLFPYSQTQNLNIRALFSYHF